MATPNVVGLRTRLRYHGTRWKPQPPAVTSYKMGRLGLVKWSYGTPKNYLYKWVTGIIISRNGGITTITLFTTGRGPPLYDMNYEILIGWLVQVPLDPTVVAGMTSITLIQYSFAPEVSIACQYESNRGKKLCYVPPVGTRHKSIRSPQSDSNPYKPLL